MRSWPKLDGESRIRTMVHLFLICCCAAVDLFYLFLLSVGCSVVLPFFVTHLFIFQRSADSCCIMLYAWRAPLVARVLAVHTSTDDHTVYYA